MALHEHPEARHPIAAGDAAYLLWFVQEVRRLSPFFPFIAGRVCNPFEWRGYEFANGAWVILDLYGTNRDPRSWSDPAQFRPERFIEPPNAFELVPQGAGDVRFTHRCPGENLTVQLMQTAVQLLVRSMRYHVPRQDLTVDLARIPALPRSGFVMHRPSRVAPVGAWSHGVVPSL
jgi:fatty-acid peroxygenase